MGSIPQRPLNAHKKGTSSVSVRTIGRQSGDDSEPAGRRRLEPIKTNIVKQRNGVELAPKPSENPKDPLVCTVLLNEKRRLTGFRIGQNGKRRRLSALYYSPQLLSES
jgi:hypothetical protein